MLKKISLKFLIALAAVLSFSFSAFSDTGERNKRNELYKQLELFSDTLSLINGEYVDEPKTKDLIYGAMRGMLSSLDPYSEFLDPERYKELKTDTEGKFGGLGIEITIKDGMLTVITPIEDTPAWKAGLKPEDKIVKIDGEITRNISSDEAVKKLRGKPGSEVVLTILREGAPKLLEVKIIRDVIKIKDIKYARMLEDGIGYIRLTEFGETTPKDIELSLSKLKEEGMSGLVLDLRNNPGGLLDVAVKAVDKFIPADKIIVSIRGRVPLQNMEFKSSNCLKYSDIPLVVLLNQGSASGSEIVAGALQDYKRAVIIGNKSFGKGSVQSVLPLSDGSAVKLTTSKYFTPLGRTIHNQGIIPDITVESGRIDFTALEPGSEDVFDKIKDKDPKAEKEAPIKEALFDYKKDNQLIRAIDIIRGIRIYQELNKKS